MPPAVIAGGVAAVGAIGGGILSAKAQKKAAKTAANSETQAAQMNIDAAERFRAQNQQNLQPWLNSGSRANALIDSFLYAPANSQYYPGEQQGAPAGTPVTTTPTGGGLGGQNRLFEQKGGGRQDGMADVLPAMFPNMGTALPNTGAGQQDWNAYLQANPDVAAEWQRVQRTGQFSSPQQYAQWHYLHYGKAEGRTVPNVAGSNPQQPGGQPQQPGVPGTQSSGYQAFVNSPYYQFGLNEGLKALNTGYAANGMLQSGAAMKGIVRYGQDYGYGKMNEFLGLAGDQSNRGLQAGGAIAGVGVNALNSITASNNAIGQAGANRAIAGGVANANMWSSIGSGLGTLASSFIK